MNNQLAIEKARNFAITKHEEFKQVRKYNGEPYHHHVCRVANLVSKFTDIPEAIQAAYLHDLIEDCNVQAEQIEYEFYPIVSTLVEEVTNFYTKENYPELPRKQRKIQECIRLGKISSLGKLIKLADIADNLMSLKQDIPDEFGPNYYYVTEKRELLEVLQGIEPNLEKIIKNLCE